MTIKLYKSKLYLALPIITLIISALFFLPDYIGFDFQAYYSAGKYIFTDPELIYSSKINPRYLYCPGFACLFSILSLFPFNQAQEIYIGILLFFALLTVLTLDDILTIKKVNFSLKLLILLSVNVGFGVFRMFQLLQSKYIVIFLVLLIIKREMENEKFNLKFFSTQSLILVFIISILPYMIFVCIIYLFHHHKKIYSKIQVKKYIIIIVEFIIFNFMFLLFPILILGFLKGFFSVSLHLNLWTSPLELNPDVIISNRLGFKRSITVIALYMARTYTGLEEWNTIFVMIITIIALIIGIY